MLLGQEECCQKEKVKISVISITFPTQHTKAYGPLVINKIIPWGCQRSAVGRLMEDKNVEEGT